MGASARPAPGNRWRTELGGSGACAPAACDPLGDQQMSDPDRGGTGCSGTVRLPLKAPEAAVFAARPSPFGAVQGGPGAPVSRWCGACPAGVAAAGEQLAV